jgi:hypothetical protein
MNDDIKKNLKLLTEMFDQPVTEMPKNPSPDMSKPRHAGGPIRYYHMDLYTYKMQEMSTKEIAEIDAEAKEEGLSGWEEAVSHRPKVRNGKVTVYPGEEELIISIRG